MNYRKMIEVLKWVKENRQGGRMCRRHGGSPYVCDNVSRFPGYSNEDNCAREDIKNDIKKEIHGRFSVPVFLGCDSYHDDEDNYLPEVIRFREEMIDSLIARYEAKVEK